MINKVVRVRNSNLELYRIIVMLFIVSHHYLVNSGLLPIIENLTPPVMNCRLRCVFSICLECGARRASTVSFLLRGISCVSRK